MAFESKQGISDLEKLCQEFDEEDRKKQEKAQKKREKKKKQKEKSLSTNQQSSNTPPSADVECKQKPTNENSPPSADVECKQKPTNENSPLKNQNKNQNKQASNASQLIVSKLERKTCKQKTKNSLVFKENEPISVLKLASMLDENGENIEEEDENQISQQEIEQYLREVSAERAELRRNLRQRFHQMCINGL